MSRQKTLALMDQGLTLAVRGECFAVTKRGKTIEQIPVVTVSEIQVFGRNQLTHKARTVSLSKGIDVVFLTTRGRYLGRLISRLSKSSALRLLQLDRVHDPVFSLAVAKTIVAGKVSNQRSLLLRIQRSRRAESIASAAMAMRQLFAPIEEAADIDTVRGLEGQAAALYFSTFGACILNDRFQFAGRSRRPPRDPVNALLSFGYTMLGKTMESNLLTAGLDPALGFLHQPAYGRPSLMLDLIEEFRPLVVDRLALRLVNRRQVTPEDFEEPLDAEFDPFMEEAPEQPAGKAVWLAESGRRIFFQVLAAMMKKRYFYPPRQESHTLRDIVLYQAYQLARLIRENSPTYQPFQLR